eukprot:GHVR01095166.1.p2 GENE.GHVR01095166.1~~GHVR01095166.1.p2  ORF type:complete len:161 (-),score=9.66 GHVR01095166.1:616-1098(-)
MVGTISGGVIISAVAGYITNSGASIAIGAFAGVVSGVWLGFIHPRVNAVSVFDSHGLLGPFLLNSFFGAFVLTPTVLAIYNERSKVINSLGTSGDLIDEIRTAHYQFVWAGISIGIGLLSGILAGSIGSCFKQTNSDFRNTKIFSNDYGLYHDSSLQYIE